MPIYSKKAGGVASYGVFERKPVPDLIREGTDSREASLLAAGWLR
jgi:hypothetical protein